jgi:hypothetical protein
VDDAEQCADRKLCALLQPRRELVPRPRVHADLATLAALATAHEDRAAHAIKVALGKRERFADPQAGAPQHDDQAAHPRPSGRSPAQRMTATISSTTGGSAG